MKQKFQRFMTGRYGIDQLGRFNMLLVILFLLLDVLIPLKKADYGIFRWIALVLLIIAYVRMFSRNGQKRYRENVKYLTVRTKVTRFFGNLRRSVLSIFGKGTDADHKIFKCPTCKQKIRVPKGKGNIEITCPKCRTAFRKRT